MPGNFLIVFAHNYELWITYVLSLSTNETSFANAHSQVIFAISVKRGWKVSRMPLFHSAPFHATSQAQLEILEFVSPLGFTFRFRINTLNICTVQERFLMEVHWSACEKVFFTLMGRLFLYLPVVHEICFWDVCVMRCFVHRFWWFCIISSSDIIMIIQNSVLCLGIGAFGSSLNWALTTSSVKAAPLATKYTTKPSFYLELIM